MGIDDAGDGVVVDVAGRPTMCSTTAMPSSSALWASMGPRNDVADGVDAGDVRGVVGVDLDEALLVELDAQVGQAEAIGDGAAADGDEDLIAFLDAAVGVLDQVSWTLPSENMADSAVVFEAELEALLLEEARAWRAYFLVHAGEGRGRGNSVMSTSEPRRLQTEPSSTPM